MAESFINFNFNNKVMERYRATDIDEDSELEEHPSMRFPDGWLGAIGKGAIALGILGGVYGMIQHNIRGEEIEEEYCENLRKWESRKERIALLLAVPERIDERVSLRGCYCRPPIFDGNMGIDLGGPFDFGYRGVLNYSDDGEFEWHVEKRFSRPDEHFCEPIFNVTGEGKYTLIPINDRVSEGLMEWRISRDG